MGNHRIEHRCLQVNITSPIMSEPVIVETWRQVTGEIVI
jgi:hypothetical protein